MDKPSFGQRLKIAFGNARYAEIAEKMGVSEATVKVYAAGRVPDADKLRNITQLTKCNLHWLITGEGPQDVTAGEGVSLDAKLLDHLRAIAREQSHEIFADAQLGGANVEQRTMELLTEYLIARGLKSVGLIETEADVMSKADLKRAEKFGFVGRAPSAIESYIREVVRDAAPLGATDEVRGIIREIVREEVDRASKVKVFPLPVRDDQAEEETTRRKAR